MGDSKGFLTYLCYSIFFFPVFVLLFVLGILKGGIFSPFVFLVIAFGNIVVLIGLWPYHLVWSIYCMARTKKFGPCMKGLLILTVPIQIALWTVIGVVGSVVMGIGYGFVWPVMETFRAVSKEGDSFGTKLFKCFTAGTWSNVWGACTIVRDFADFSFHSYFSVMEGLLESKGECPIELKVTQIPGCILSAILGVAVDVPMITLIMLYKSPILLFKGWKRLLHDLVGREGPFLETVCVPFAGLLILLWPVIVLFITLAGIFSSLFVGGYAAVVAYQESSTKRGLLYVIAAISLFDEYTNDFLYLPEGSCFPRPRFRARESSASTFFPVKGLHEQLTNSNSKGPPTRTPSEKAKSLSAVMIWNNYFRACSHFGKELLRDGAIGIADLRSWQNSKNKIVNIGIPAYAFMDCFLRSINSGSSGFLMRDNVELTSSNRPEGRVFDWMFEPMSIMKEQLKSLNLIEAEEHYIYKFCLYSGDTARVEAWQNGGYPPEDKIRRAQLEGICRRLLGFCLTLSRLPTSHRRFHVVVREIEQEAKHLSADNGADVSETVPILVEMKQVFGDLAMNIIVRLLSGKRYYGACACGDEESRRCQKALGDFMHLVGLNMVSDAIPILGWIDVLQGYVGEMKRTAREVDSVLGSWVKEHHQKKLTMGTSITKGDFIDVLLSVMDENHLCGRDADTVIKATLLSLLLGGSDTTVVTLTWALSLLLNHRSVLKKALDELDNQVGMHRQVNESDINNLTYLQAIIKETLRLYPAAPISPPREALEDCFISGFHVPAGTRLLVNLWKLHRDPRVWSDPFEFRPERFLTENAGLSYHGYDFEFIPFGSGRRACPGIKFADQVLHLTLAKLLQGFEFAIVADFPVDMTESPGLTNPKATPLEVLLTPRLHPMLYEDQI